MVVLQIGPPDLSTSYEGWGFRKITYGSLGLGFEALPSSPASLPTIMEHTDLSRSPGCLSLGLQTLNNILNEEISNFSSDASSDRELPPSRRNLFFNVRTLNVSLL